MQERVGRRVRELRKARGLTQEQAAEKAGTNVKYFGAIERGEVNLTLVTVGKISAALDVPPRDLFDHDEPATDDREMIGELVAAVLERGDDEKVARLRAFLENVFR